MLSKQRKKITTRQGNMERGRVLKNLVKRDWNFPNSSGGNDIFSLHPYPAKFIPEIPRALIKDLGVPKDSIVCDPFCGRGTTMIEAQSLGYQSMGIDLNPIACLISKVATTALPNRLCEIAEDCIECAKALQNVTIPSIPNLDHWFTKSIQDSIARLITSLDDVSSPRIRDALRLALSSTIVRVSNQESDTRYAAVPKKVSTKTVFELFRKVCARYEQVLHKQINHSQPCTILNKDILDVKPSDFPVPVGLVVCSPPYPNAYEYWLYHKYRMWWLGYDPLYVKEHEIGARPHYFRKNPQTPEDFKQQLEKTLTILRKACLDDAYLCFVLGNSKIYGKIIDNTALLTEAAESAHFDIVSVLNRDIALSRKSFNLANSRLKSENVVILRQKKPTQQTNIKKISLRWHGYKYFQYERKLALREVTALKGISTLKVNGRGVEVSLQKPSRASIEKLVYFSTFNGPNGLVGETIQAKLENDPKYNGSQKRQSTRYSVHGLHEYKGKFNPQVVRGILNYFAPRDSARVVDPFCGSGTTLIECSIAGHVANGWDMNPFAVYLSNAKLLALDNKPSKLQAVALRIFSEYEKNPTHAKFTLRGPREKYLINWFPQQTLSTFEALKKIIETTAERLAPVFKVILSDLFRDYSLQEPSDLRIRRRKSPLPSKPLLHVFQHSVNKMLTYHKHSYEILGKLHSKSRAFLADGRELKEVSKYSDLQVLHDYAITSPPYAMALPYIDTQRLSLVWLDLLSPSDIRSAEESLIGSREARKTTLDKLRDSLNRNEAQLPESVAGFCRTLEMKLTSRDGFRKQAVPMLLYRYLTDMQRSFRVVRSIVKKSGLYALIVGTNHTTLGDERVYIDTPGLLVDLALKQGWSVVEMFELETYRRYGIHAANAVQDEILVILKNE